ncbi:MULTISPECIES: SapC family protein [unclassified Sphingomonas]|uniref:SapC family protein n=1 Tax=unclassified Sphingomonas TaxID=196159 RepID=UPI002151C64A|nr:MULTISPECIES: SapC family protein [unclassified Sphingomonas]MCR5871326.1 SapC family protein [Sphingomonas sp. J344]UUY00370.1 SapC family protein [Sphingomonas sp. J315]
MTDHAVLTPEDHRDLRIRRERDAAYGDAVMSCITTPDEFRRVQAHYPILFRRDVERDAFMALAMFGFQDGENLFLNDGHWDADYVPLTIDIQPFLIGGPASGDGPKQVHVDLASPRIAGDEGVRVFDDTGRPTPYLETIAEQLGALDAGWQGSADFFAALRRHDLLEPLTLEITLDDGSTNSLVGFHAVNEDRLRALDGDALGDLHRDGHLMPLFMAVASIGNFTALIARKNRRNADG